MEHWNAALIASLAGIVMAVVVVLIGFRVAGPAPTVTLPDNFVAATHSGVSDAAGH